MKSYLIIGCGYLGERVARLCLARGDRVHALTRSADRARRWRIQGIEPIVGDVLDPASLAALPEAETCLYAVGYDRSQTASKEQVYVEGLSNVLTALAGKVGRLIYISSTSVYGQQNGEWVNEESPTLPQSEGGKVCLQAESLIHDLLSHGDWAESCILRLAGIYGPGRLLARKEQLLAGAVLSGNPEAWLNLIHVDDAAAAIVKWGAECSPLPRSLYLLSDAEPVLRQEFYGLLAKLCGAPSPTFAQDSADLNKRCDSRVVREDLKLSLRYRSFRDGLQAAIE